MSTASVSERLARPGLARLVRSTRVELRKSVDTRSGRWLLAVVVLVTALVLVPVVWTADPADLTFTSLVETALTPQLLLVPVVAILAATSEWSHRTALTTFVLEPRRGRVVAAKATAVLVLTAVAVLGAVVAAAVAHVVAVVLLDAPGAWALDVGGLARMLAVHVLSVLQGFAFGLLLMGSAAAIVAFFVVPTAWTVLTMLVTPLRGPAQWLDLSYPTSALLDGTMVGVDWARLGTASLLWLVLPLVLGTWRTLHREVG